MKTKDDILNQMDEVIQYFINHPDNQPNTDHCRNVDRLINLKADLANGDNKSDDECTLPVVVFSEAEVCKCLHCYPILAEGDKLAKRCIDCGKEHLQT